MGATPLQVIATRRDEAVVQRGTTLAEEREFAGRVAATARAIARAMQEDRDMDAIRMTEAVAFAAARRLRQLDMEAVA